MRIKDVLRLQSGLIERKLGKKNDIVCRSILCCALSCEKLFIIANPEKNVKPRHIKKVLKLTYDFCRNKPLEYVINKAEFMSLQFYVDENVLIPRDDTESLTEYAIEVFKGGNVLDLCTGSGCIAVSLAVYIENIGIDAADISVKAVEIAKRNAEVNGVSDKINFFVLDIMSTLPESMDKYDMLISNPPYIKSEVIDGLEPQVKDFEPRIALDGGEDGLEFYRRICSIAEKHLKPSANVILEIGTPAQAREVSAILQNSGCFKDISIRKDLSGNERMVTAVSR